MCAGCLNMSHFHFKAKQLQNVDFALFLKAQPTLLFSHSLSRLNIYSLSSRTHDHMPQRQIEKWMNWASKHEPFLLSMAKWQINIKLCDFFSEIIFDFFVLLLLMRENMAHWDSNALSNALNRHLEVTFSCAWTWAISASSLENGKKCDIFRTLTHNCERTRRKMGEPATQSR